MNKAENSISEPLGFNIFWGRMPPNPLEVRAFCAGKTCLTSIMKVCLAVALCGNGCDGGGGGGGNCSLLNLENCASL